MKRSGFLAGLIGLPVAAVMPAAAMATGGPVRMDRPCATGERGPEMLIPVRSIDVYDPRISGSGGGNGPYAGKMVTIRHVGGGVYEWPS